jgi:DNA primase
MSGGFEQYFIDDVRARTSIVDLVTRDVRLTKARYDYTGLCPFHSEKSPSFTVSETKGFYHCFGCGAHGDVFDWVQDRFGLGFVEAVEELAIQAGLQPDRDGRTRPKAKPIARPKADDIKRDKAETIAWARGIFSQSQPATGTIVETYLRSRGIWADAYAGGLAPTIRFHPRLFHAYSEQHFPAMVACVQDQSGKITGIHRTFLQADGSGKAAVSKPKLMAGSCWHGAIRLCPAQSRLAVAEGIETAASVMLAAKVPTWAAGSMGNMAALRLPGIVRDLVLCIDADSDPIAMNDMLQKAKAFHGSRGIRLSVARPPAGKDFNDVLRGV